MARVYRPIFAQSGWTSSARLAAKPNAAEVCPDGIEALPENGLKSSGSDPSTFGRTRPMISFNTAVDPPPVRRM